METILYIVIGILTKHLLCDWIWQPREIALNKGKNNVILTFHCAIQGVGMLVFLLLVNWLLFPISPKLLLLIPLYDMVVHWVIDFFSSRLIIHGNGLTPNDKMFWNTIGIDQYAHYLSYLIIIILFI